MRPENAERLQNRSATTALAHATSDYFLFLLKVLKSSWPSVIPCIGIEKMNKEHPSQVAGYTIASLPVPRQLFAHFLSIQDYLFSMPVSDSESDFIPTDGWHREQLLRPVFMGAAQRRMRK
jgi:hypothetical protein